MLKSLVKMLPSIRRIIEERDSLREAFAGRNANVDSPFDEEAYVSARVISGDHRGMVGVLWDEVGQLQHDFLVAHGLQPTHRLLDVGCGSLRGGIHFIPYLNSGNYWGIDINSSLIEAGWNEELRNANLQDRQPREQLVCLKDFEFHLLNEKFEFAIALSVFTHLNFNRIRRCLTRLAPVMESGGKFFATFFEVQTEQNSEEPIPHDPGGVVTFSCRNPFHYRFEDFQHAISGLPLTVRHHGEWGHPRNQKMLEFEVVR